MPNPKKRPTPADFDVIFVEFGRLECEAHYRARRTTVTSWLEQCGKERLIARRAAFVKFQRSQAQEPRRMASQPFDGGKYGLAT